MTLPHSSSVCIWLWPLLFSGPMQMKRVSPAEIVKQHRLMFLCGPKMWMFTVDRGLIAFLRQLKSIGPLMGPIKQWEKPNVTMGLIVSEWTHLALCGEWKCVAYLKKIVVREREGEKVERNEINRSEWLCTAGNLPLSVSKVHLEPHCLESKELSYVALAVTEYALICLYMFVSLFSF